MHVFRQGLLSDGVCLLQGVDPGIASADTLFPHHCSVQCNYLHRIPPATAILPNSATDIFGREKHADYKDDMGGTGSFSRQNRTLYIGKVREEATRDETNAVVRRHFGEWGDIERGGHLSFVGSVELILFADVPPPPLAAQSTSWRLGASPLSRTSTSTRPSLQRRP